jgi:hypothetical protein
MMAAMASSFLLPPAHARRIASFSGGGEGRVGGDEDGIRRATCDSISKYITIAPLPTFLRYLIVLPKLLASENNKLTRNIAHGPSSLSSPRAGGGGGGGAARPPKPASWLPVPSSWASLHPLLLRPNKYRDLLE